MKSLKTLIRIQKRELDALRREMVVLEERREGYAARVAALNDQLQHEIKTASELAELRGFFGDFSKVIKQKQKELAARILLVEQEMRQVSDKIMLKFADLKKYEISLERYLAREAKKQADKEQKELDEVGIRAFFHGES